MGADMNYKTVTLWTCVVIVIAITIGLLYDPPVIVMEEAQRLKGQ